MSNPYYNVTTTIPIGATAQSSYLNSQYQAIAIGFNNVDAALSRAVKITGLTTGGEVTATPNSFMLLNGSGAPYSSTTINFSPNLGGNKITNTGTATVSSDYINFGQVNQLISAAAFGSPTVVNLPSFSIANALQALRVNAGGVAVEFADIIPRTVNSGESLVSVGGSPVWAYPTVNLLPDGSMAQYGAYAPDPAARFWSGGLSVTISPPSSGLYEANFTSAALSSLGTTAADSPFGVVGQTYTASVYLRRTTNAASYSLFIAFLDAGGVQIGAITSAAAPTETDNVYRRFSVTATAPAGTSRVRVGMIKDSGPPTNVFFSRFQLELGSTASPWAVQNPESYFGNRVAAGVNESYSVSKSASVLRVGRGVGRLELGGSLYAETEYGAAIECGYDLGGEAANYMRILAGALVLPKLAGFSEIHDNGTMTATPTVDFANGHKQKGAINVATTITLTALSTGFVADGLRLNITNTDATARAVSFTSSATLRPKGGASYPTIPAGAEYEFIFYWDGARFVISWSPV